MVITICRKRKIEAARAMFDLLQKGWSIDHPLTEVKSSGTEKGDYCYRKNRYTSRQGTASSVWMAKLKRDENNKHDKEDQPNDNTSTL